MTSIRNKVLNLNKPSGPTSFALVRRVQTQLKAQKAGHIGTLDPMAEGVLPICLDRSTRIIQYLTHLPKVYLAVMTLGAVTDTQDHTGNILEEKAVGPLDEELLRNLMKQFEGPQTQVPPMYSAKKKNGIPLYKLARNGINVKREPVPIRIHQLEFLGLEDNRVEFRVHCSAGTYIRTLCHDMGHRLGCGAHLSRLIREQVGPFGLETALTPEALDTAWADGTLSRKLLEPDQALEFLPEIRVSPDSRGSIAHGRAILREAVADLPQTVTLGAPHRVMHETEGLLAIAEPVTGPEEFYKLAPHDVAFKLKRVFIEP